MKPGHGEEEKRIIKCGMRSNIFWKLAYFGKESLKENIYGAEHISRYMQAVSSCFGTCHVPFLEKACLSRTAKSSPLHFEIEISPPTHTHTHTPTP